MTDIIEQQEAAFAETIFSAVLGAQLTQTAYLGYRLGWYDALAKAGESGLTASELAENTQSSKRYAREWLEQQAVAGWIQCPNAEASSYERKFVLPKAHANVLTDRDSLTYMMPLPAVQTAFGQMADVLVKSYKNDTGVSWDAIGNTAREEQAAMNRPFFLKQLPKILEKCLDPVTAKRMKETGGKVADIGAGFAWSSIGVARHFPSVKVDAYDLDEPSVVAARENIDDAGLTGRVQAHLVDAASAVNKSDPYDLVMALECVHDMSDPISVLRTMRLLAGSKGTVIVMDERVAEKFSTKKDELELMFYGFSCMCCLPDGKSGSGPSAATGTVMRPSILRAYAQQAGFRDIEILPHENDFFRFYKLIPHVN